MKKREKNQSGHGAKTEDETLSKDKSNTRSKIASLEMAKENLWTTAEFEKAKPSPVIEVSDEILKKLVADQSTNLQPAATIGGYNYPPPYTRHEVICPYSIYPYVSIGKLFYECKGNKFFCTAASIGNYSIWTAGHDLHEGDGNPDSWHKRVVFVPAYKDGNAPYGQWPASHLFVRTAWYKNGSPNGLCEDMGGAVLFPQGGKKISQAVGWLGFAWNWSRFQHWNAFGYPATFPFNGQRLIVSQSSFAYNDPGGVSCNPKPHAIGCDMTGGRGGGPWIWRFGIGNYLNGNNSYQYANHPEELYSPYFGDEAKSLWDVLVKSTP